MRAMGTHPDELPLRIICDRRRPPRRRARVALLVGLIFLVASCDGGSKEELSGDYLCDLPSSSLEKEAVLKEIGAGEVRTTIFAGPSDLVESVRSELRKVESGKDVLPIHVCLFQGAAGGSAASDSEASVRIMLQWAVPNRGKAAGRPLRDASHYVVNGLPAEANEGDAKFSFSCVMPGEFRDASRQAQMVGWASLTGGPRKGSQRDWDVRHVALSYLMAQKAVDALGCENKPLQGDPVVKPVKG